MRKRNLLATLFISRGTPLLLGGDEAQLREALALLETMAAVPAARLARRRLRALGMRSFQQYLDHLEQGDGDEWQAFTNALTTNLTAFFREAHHFAILAAHVRKQARGRPLRIWCAASSTGEEPYSLAITACEAFNTLSPPVQIIASDILEMPSLAGVEFLHGDFREDAVLSRLLESLNGEQVDLVLSDMAPNKSGVDAVDQPRAMHLAELAMDFADGHLRTGGTFLIKLFQGTDFDGYVRELRRRYAKVVIRKPAASRKRSPEVYALAQGKLAHMKQ